MNMKSKHILLVACLVIGSLVLAGSAFAEDSLSESLPGFAKTKLVQSEPVSSQHPSPSSMIGSVSRGVGLSQRDLLVLLKGGRHYDFRTKQWGWFKPEGNYRSNIIATWDGRRIKGSSVPEMILGQMHSSCLPSGC